MKKNYVIVVAGLGLVQLVLLSTAAQAQSAKSTDEVTNLNQVVVTATRSPQKLSEIGRVVTIVTAEQISRAQDKTLPELLNTLPGLTFSGAQNAPGQSTSVFLRGASAGNTLILIDGFPVNDPSSIAGNYDLNSIVMDQIERIEILKGAGSTLYGSDAVAGVINIITKQASSQGVKASVQLNGGSYNTFRQSADINGTVGKTGIAVNLSNSDSRGFSAAALPPAGGTGFDNDGLHQKSFSANISHDVTAKFTLRGNVQFSRNNGDNDNGAYTDDKDYTYVRTYLMAGLGAKWSLAKGTLVVNASQNNTWNNFTNYPSDYGSVYSASKLLGRVTNAEAVLNYDLASFLSMTSGADFKYYNTLQNSVYQSPGFSTPLTFIPGSSNISSVYNSFFIKAGIFHMELGGRFNHHNQYGNNFTYTINPSVLLFDRLKVFATMASAYKAPSLYQLNSQYKNPFGTLKPEITTASYEAGFDLDIVKELSFNTSFFQRKTKDVIAFYTEPVTFNPYYINADHQDDKGFESELSLKKDKLTASAWIAYVVGTQTNVAGAQAHNLYRRPKNSYGVNVNYQVVQAFSIGLNYKFTGNRQDQDFNTPPYPAIVDLPHYQLLDAHLQLQATKKLSVFVDLNNLLNQKYVDWIGYNTRAFNFMAGIKYRIN